MGCTTTDYTKASQKLSPSSKICNTKAANLLVLNNDQFELIYKYCTAVIENSFVPSTEKS